MATSRVGRIEPGALPPPIVEAPSITVASRPASARRAASASARWPMTASGIAIIAATGIDVATASRVELGERRFERGARSSCRHGTRASADGAGPVDTVASRPAMMPALRAAEQLVAAEQHERRRPPPRWRGRPVRRAVPATSAASPQIAAAEILDDRRSRSARPSATSASSDGRSAKPSTRKFEG